MALRTILQACSEAELAALREMPATIGELDKRGADCATTHFAESVSFFLCGEAYPSSEHHGVLAGLFGFESVSCSRLENGAFHMVSPAQARELASALAAVKLGDVRERATGASIEELVADSELYDLEVLIGDDTVELPEMIAGELASIIEFYRVAAENTHGAVIYTS